MKVCLVAKQGGHFRQLLRLSDAWRDFDERVFVLDRNEVNPQGSLDGKVYELRPSDRQHKFAILLNFASAWCLLRRERPDVILSTGASLAFPVVLVGHLLRIPSIWVDSQANTRKLSMTGRLLSRFCARTYTQWEALAEPERRIRYRGRL